LIKKENLIDNLDIKIKIIYKSLYNTNVKVFYTTIANVEK